MHPIGPFRHLPPVCAVLASLALHAAAVGTALWISPTTPVPAVPPPARPVTIVMLPAAAPAAPEPEAAALPDRTLAPPAVDAEVLPLPRRPTPSPSPPSPASSPAQSPAPVPVEPAGALPNPALKPVPPVAPVEQPAPETSPQTVAVETAPASTLASPAPAPIAAAATPGPDIAMAVTTVPAAPRFQGDGLAKPMPAYPRQARRLGQQGTVLLRVRVAADGRALAVKLLASSGHELLDAAARDAVARWRFRPARQGSAAVEGTVEVPVVFRLTD